MTALLKASYILICLHIKFNILTLKLFENMPAPPYLFCHFQDIFSCGTNHHLSMQRELTQIILSDRKLRFKAFNFIVKKY